MILANEILEIDEVAAIVSQNLGEEINLLSVGQGHAMCRNHDHLRCGAVDQR